MAVNPTDVCGGSSDHNIPQWKKDLIIRRRTRVLQVGSSTANLKLTCPAVVSNLRDPEICSSFDSVDKFHRLSSSGDEEDHTARNSFSSLNQDEQDFPSSITSCSGDSFGSSMRLLDLDVYNETNKIVSNGPDVKSKQSEVSVNTSGGNNNIIMGEDTIVKKYRHVKNSSDSPLARRKQKNQSLKRVASSDNEEPKQTPKQNGVCFPNKDEDCLSDSSEELQYGPGIVNKLKTKYMSMTLREQKRHTRPSIMNLRRAASLENMLEGDLNPAEQSVSSSEPKAKTELTAVSCNRISHIKKPICVENNSNQRSMRQFEYRRKDKMKRARSMDTLLKPEILSSKPKYHESNRSILSNYDLRSDKMPFVPFVNENIIIVEHSTVSSHQTKNGPRPEDLNAVPASKELPPPDVVKQTLKIFETSQHTKVKLNQYNSVKPLESSKTNRTTPASRNPSDKTKISSTKPALSPKPSPEKIRQNRTRTTGSPKKCQKNVVFPGLSTTDGPSSSADLVNKGIKSIDHRPCIEEQFSESNNLNGFDKIDSYECSKPVLESALENIRKGGTSMHYSFRNDPSSDLSKSHLPRQNNCNTAQALNTSLLHQKYPLSPVSIVAPLRTHNSPQTKQIGIIRPLVSTINQTSHPVLTEQEIEKNLINRVKSIEHPINKVVVAIKGLPDNVVIGSVTSDVMSNSDLSMVRVCQSSKTKAQGLWDDKQLWQQNQNTIVFNFSDRKEVPDYIENDGIVLQAKGDWSRPRSDCDRDDDDDDDPGTLVGPPSPCHITFEGANVLINGKSNLRKSPGRVKMRIKFDDDATTTFEYPSEASLSMEVDPAVEGVSGAPHVAGVPPPDYLPPPVPRGPRVKNPLNRDPANIMAKGRAPRPPVQTSVMNLAVAPPVPKRSPLRKSPSDPGNLTIQPDSFALRDSPTHTISLDEKKKPLVVEPVKEDLLKSTSDARNNQAQADTFFLSSTTLETSTNWVFTDNPDEINLSSKYESCFNFDFSQEKQFECQPASLSDLGVRTELFSDPTLNPPPPSLITHCITDLDHHQSNFQILPSSDSCKSTTLLAVKKTGMPCKSSCDRLCEELPSETNINQNKNCCSSLDPVDQFSAPTIFQDIHELKEEFALSPSTVKVTDSSFFPKTSSHQIIFPGDFRSPFFPTGSHPPETVIIPSNSAFGVAGNLVPLVTKAGPIPLPAIKSKIPSLRHVRKRDLSKSKILERSTSPLQLTKSSYLASLLDTSLLDTSDAYHPVYTGPVVTRCFQNHSGTLPSPVKSNPSSPTLSEISYLTSEHSKPLLILEDWPIGTESLV